jgi:hypothetical protein
LGGNDLKIQKHDLMEMERCYAVSCMDIGGEPYAFFATEGKGGCAAFDLATFTKKVPVWEGPGGTMSIVPIPGRPGEFLAGQKFFRLYEWEEAEMVWVKEKDGRFETKTVLKLPYLHRFDILCRNGVNYFIGCTLASHKDTREDWSRPGSVYTARMPEDWGEPFEWEVLKEDLYQNHGYEHVTIDGREAGMISGESGVYVVYPPETPGGRWELTQIMEQPVSDIAAIDLDGDGEMEIAAIEPFHGNRYRIYKKIGAEWRCLFVHPEISDFYHVAASGRVGGVPVFVGGCRRGRKQLFLLYWDQKAGCIRTVTVDEGTGPSNACLVNRFGKDYLISANRECARAAVYELAWEEE